MVETTDLGTAIRRLRGGRTELVVADAGDISASSWSLYESGGRNPRKPMLQKIARGLGCEVKAIEEETWTVRNERLAAEEAKAQPGGNERVEERDSVLHAVNEHIEGVAHHLREIAALMLQGRTP